MCPPPPLQPHIYRFHDTAAYRARGYEKTFQILPWAIGDEIPGETKTLPRYLKGRSAAGRDAFNCGLQIFQNICSAVSFAHFKCGAHGHLTAHHVLLTTLEGQGKEGRLDVRLYGFKALREKAEAKDNIALGKLGVTLLAGRDRKQLPGPDEDIRAWIAVAEKSDQKVQKMLLDLLRGSSSAEHATHIVSGILFCEGLISVPGSRKRRTTNPTGVPTKQSRLLAEPAPLRGVLKLVPPAASNGSPADASRRAPSSSTKQSRSADGRPRPCVRDEMAYRAGSTSLRPSRPSRPGQGRRQGEKTISGSTTDLVPSQPMVTRPALRLGVGHRVRFEVKDKDELRKSKSDEGPAKDEGEETQSDEIVDEVEPQSHDEFSDEDLSKQAGPKPVERSGHAKPK